MAFTKEQVAKVYVATFNRAPDAAGLNYWLNNSGFTNINDVASSFFESNEAKVMYPANTSPTVMVEIAYQNLFGRTSDAAGLSYWVRELETGNISQSLMLQAMINGAQNTTEFGNDATIMTNKTTIGIKFADAGLDNVNAAINIMLGITDDDTSVEIAINIIESSKISVENGFTSNWLEGKTFYVPSSWADNKEGEYSIITISFTNNTLTMTGYDNDIVDLNPLPYSITAEGVINFSKLGNDIAITMNSFNDVGVSIISFGSYAKPAVMYFDQEKAESELSSLQIEIADISIENGFTEEWLNGKTLFGAFDWGSDGWTFSETTFLNGVVSFNQTIDGNFTENYTLTNDGKIYVTNNGGNFIWSVEEITNDYIRVTPQAGEQDYFYFESNGAHSLVNNNGVIGIVDLLLL